jgi:glycerate 2-kinase
MNILVAPNSMKGSLNADEFADAVERGLRKVSPVFNVRTLPIADGGDYTGHVLMNALNAQEITCNVTDPLGRPIRALMGIAGQTAIIEMAAASGMRLLRSDELNPMMASTAGTGEMLRHAVSLGCTTLLLGVGGSATIDGGIGMLGALGFSFYDTEGAALPPVPASLLKVADIHTPADWKPETEIVILYDVNNPLLGPEGAASVFGPQKGADADTVQRLEQGLNHWVQSWRGKPESS